MKESSNSSHSPKLSRRRFLAESSVAAAVVSGVPSQVLGGARQVAPNDRINIAHIGCGTQGLRQLMPALESKEIRVCAVCDPNRKSDDYPEWGPHELNDKIRKFL